MKKRFCLAVSLLFLLFCSLSCEKELFKGEPEEGALFYRYGYECLVNGEIMSYVKYEFYYRQKYRHAYYGFTRPFAFSGYLIDNNTHRISGVNADELAFYLSLGCEWSEAPFYDGSNFINPLLFYIVGDGDNPFREGVEYSNPENIVYYFPESPVFFMGGRVYQNKEKDWNYGVEVKLLSSSLRFGYSKRDGVEGGDLLDLYFDFEEVITKVPEGYMSSPTVGDTIKVSNGHFSYSLLFDIDKSLIQMFIVPK